MNTTSYGLLEGWMMIGWSLLIVGLLLAIRYYITSDKKYTLILGALTVFCIICDTLMWQFNIETNVVDYKFGNGEQLTVFGVMVFILLGLIVFWMPKKKGGVND